MSRLFGDADNFRGSDDRFDQFPRWVVRSRHFADLSPQACKVLVYLVHKQNWHSRIVPETSPSELAMAAGLHRNQAARAVNELAVLGVIALERREGGRRLRMQLVFKDAERQLQTEQQPGKGPALSSPPLDARYLECGAPSSDRTKSRTPAVRYPPSIRCDDQPPAALAEAVH